MVREVRDLTDFNNILQETSGGKIAVVDFYADWCGPCKYIAPVFEVLSQRYTNAIFCKVNVDLSRDAASIYRVQAMPTFIIFKNKAEVERVAGADPNKLENTIKTHYSEAPPVSANAANPRERAFLEKFAKYSMKMHHYTDIVNQTLALSLVPAHKLKEEATDANGVVNKFLLAKALLEWFKNDFFSWVDTPTCSFCGKKPDPKNQQKVEPNAEEAADNANYTEVYVCECGNEVRFARYDNPTVLLRTRAGRCGEWTKCFALFAASLEFDFRIAYDISDHLWTELWIPELDRWVHCDSCENVIDSPLLYEKGWQKKLSYVIAVGTDHIHDVSWRYVLNNLEALKRRGIVREAVLARFLSKLNDRMQANSDAARTEELKRRRIREIIEFLVPGEKKCDDQYGGRTTGSEDWRVQRGETGASPKKRQQIVLRPNDKELATGEMRIRYNCSTDVYTRGEDKIKGWASYIYKSKNVMRKVENDWKVTYLCRKEGKEEGEITWAVDLTGVKGKSARLRICGAQTFENADIFIMTCADDICLEVPASGELVINELPSSLLKITAVMKGGSGNGAFQHAQLFRCNHGETDDQLTIEIDFD
ncbi:unnamed protein product [Auanema sp. JU1783]|nr:unnamed protein product [Auanema sp. JU1783]